MLIELPPSALFIQRLRFWPKRGDLFGLAIWHLVPEIMRYSSNVWSWILDVDVSSADDRRSWHRCEDEEDIMMTEPYFMTNLYCEMKVRTALESEWKIVASVHMRVMLSLWVVSKWLSHVDLHVQVSVWVWNDPEGRNDEQIIRDTVLLTPIPILAVRFQRPSTRPRAGRSSRCSSGCSQGPRAISARPSTLWLLCYVLLN